MADGCHLEKIKNAIPATVGPIGTKLSMVTHTDPPNRRAINIQIFKNLRWQTVAILKNRKTMSYLGNVTKFGTTLNHIVIIALKIEVKPKMSEIEIW